jgi:hypothetical protein
MTGNMKEVNWKRFVESLKNCELTRQQLVDVCANLSRVTVLSPTNRDEVKTRTRKSERSMDISSTGWLAWLLLYTYFCWTTDFFELFKSRLHL